MKIKLPIKTVSEAMSYFGFYEHTCQGANNAKTWLTPCGTEFYLFFKGGDEPERCTWIEYCPYCGIRPETLKKNWGKRVKEPFSGRYENGIGTSPVKNIYWEIIEPENGKSCLVVHSQKGLKEENADSWKCDFCDAVIVKKESE
jgi:hypothetical protein